MGDVQSESFRGPGHLDGGNTIRAEVAIVIVTYNSEAEIGKCLRSVFAQQDSVRQRIIVLDNASTDSTVTVLREEFPDVELIESKTNLGFAAGVNLAASRAEAEYLLLLNPDTIILDHAVDTIFEFARKNPAHGIYGGRIVNSDGSTDPMSCWGQPSLWSMASFALGLTTLFRHNAFFDPESLGSWQRDTIREVGAITGCFLLANAELWRRLDGLDERYFMYGEDVDFARRALSLGFRPILCPEARLLHEGGRSSSTTAHKTLLLYRGKAHLVCTHWHGVARRVGLIFLVAGVGLRALLAKPFSARRTREAYERWGAVWMERRHWVRGYAP